MSTPPQANLTKDVMTTPIGDHDKKPKIQICLELREKEVTSTRKSKNGSKIKVEESLEVTVMFVKNLPQNFGNKRPNPFVKVRLLPQDDIQITELKLEKDNAQYQYIEVFTFPLNNKTTNLAKSLLEVQVCDKKATRNAKQFGNVSIPLHNLKFGQPSCEWHYLKVPKDEEDKIINNKASNTKHVMKENNTPTPKKSKPERKRKTKLIPVQNHENDDTEILEGNDDDDTEVLEDDDNENVEEDPEMNENIENLTKKGNALVIHSDVSLDEDTD